MLQKLRGSFSHTPQTLGLVWAASSRLTVLLGVLTLISAVVPIGVAWVAKTIIDAVMAHNRELTLQWVLVEAGLVITQQIIQRGLSLTRSLLGMQLGVAINVRILEKAVGLELRHFEDSEFYDRMTRARREASSRPLSVVNELFQMVQNALTLVGYVALLVQYSALVTCGLVIAAIPATIAELRFANQAFRLRNWRSPDTRRLNYLEYVLANDDHAKEVKLFGLGDMLLGRYRTLADTFLKEDGALAKRRAVWALALSFLAVGAFYGAYLSMALAAAAGVLTLGLLTLYVMAFRQGQQAFTSVLTAIGGMYEDNLYMSNLFEFLAFENAPPHVGVQRGERPGDGIRFEGVGFRYPGRDTFALRGIDLHVPHGESMAIVGHNGAGKTTFIKLLTGLYKPTEGRVLLDGTALDAFDTEALRRRMSVLFQDFNQYQLSLRENVGFGSVPHLTDGPRIERAVERGGADQLSLKGGLDSQLGRWFKDGAELSGGQWQKVALARAFMREEADILILDEPTAALDAEAEQAVFERFASLTKGRTTILISHRFPTVRMADRIIVVDQGAIVEQGTHAELLAQNGRYSALFKLQASGYN